MKKFIPYLFLLAVLASCNSASKDKIASKEDIIERNFRAGQEFQNGNWLGAISLSEEVLEMDPSNAEAYSRISNCYYQLRKPEKSLFYANKAHQSAPNERLYLVNRSQCYEKIGKLDSAIVDLLEACKLREEGLMKDKILYFDIGQLRCKNGQYKEALLAYENSLNADSTWYLVYSERAKVYKKLGEFENAKADSLKGYLLNPYK